MSIQSLNHVHTLNKHPLIIGAANSVSGPCPCAELAQPGVKSKIEGVLIPEGAKAASPQRLWFGTFACNGRMQSMYSMSSAIMIWDLRRGIEEGEAETERRGFAAMGIGSDITKRFRRGQYNQRSMSPGVRSESGAITALTHFGLAHSGAVDLVT
ncbi:hypothetical protein J6590_071845 [Homalodisca vitripennis]|nr:hypothetical protein J6590_071845 [Homalodisca vitripennis]